MNKSITISSDKLASDARIVYEGDIKDKADRIYSLGSAIETLYKTQHPNEDDRDPNLVKLFDVLLDEAAKYIKGLTFEQVRNLQSS